MSTQDRAPAFPFYAKDWLADPKVRSMSYDEKGRYIELLASMWEHGDEGCVIPRKTAERLLGRRCIAHFCNGAAPVIETYEQQGECWLFSGRLSAEAQKCRSRSEAARRAVNERWARARGEPGTDVLPT